MIGGNYKVGGGQNDDEAIRSDTLTPIPDRTQGA
jgi:hypothetical protein